ncbi:MAG: putative bacteriocin export ABC transporter [Breznakia sp.]
MIEAKKITKKFDGIRVLDNINITIQDCEMVAIVGVSGSGKTTLLNILGLIDDDFEGTLCINKKAFHHMKKHTRIQYIRNNINYLFQNYALVDDETIIDNLMYALYYTKYSKQEKKALIEDALLEVGLNGMSEKKIFKLSGGEQQRVALARLILKPANIILADEPTGNLDDENRNVVLRILHKLNEEGKTIVIVTHDREVANSCNRIITLSNL